MLISKLGEFGLIERFKKHIRLDSSVIRGPGDDCAVINFSKDKYLLFTCDMIVEGVDFRPQEDPYLIGRKAVAVCISDIAACAGTPRYCLISLGMSRNKTTAFADKISKGMRDIARNFKVNLVGGDLSAARKTVIDVSMIGLVSKKRLVLRSGAGVGDIIFVTGALGGSILGKHLKFTPRVKEAQFLTKKFKISSMIDISDGLIQDLGHILSLSNKGAVIYEKLIPVSPKARNTKDALYSGEDFELLFTMSQQQARKLIDSGMRNFKPIGEITSKEYGLSLIGINGRKKDILDKGFKHF